MNHVLTVYRIPLKKKKCIKKHGFYGRLIFLLWYEVKSLKHSYYFLSILLHQKLKVPMAATRKVFVYKIQENPIHTILKYGDYYDFMDR